MAALPDDFFTVATFGTLAGTAAITAAVAGALYKAYGCHPAKWGLPIALVVMAAALFLADKITNAKADVVGFFNSFLVYLTAAGISDRLASPTRGGLAAGARPYWRSWFH